MELRIETVRVAPEAAADWVSDASATGFVGMLSEERRKQFLGAMGGVEAVDSFATVVCGGEQASMAVVREFPVPSGSNDDIGGGPRRFEMKDVGLTLAVTPMVAAGAVDLGVELTRRSLEGFQASGNDWSPAFAQTEVKASVSVPSGQSALFNLGAEGGEPDRELTLVLITPAVVAAESVAVSVAVSSAKDQVEIEAKFIEMSTAAGGKTFFTDDGVTERVLTPAKFQEVMRGLNQKKGVDLMSAPRVTTRVGQNAVINVIREFRYATEFDPPKAGAPWTPTQFETRNVGVTLNVEPLVNDDGRIDLKIEDEVVEFEGFLNYGAEAAPTLLADGKLQPAGGGSGSVINQPIFWVRRSASRVSVGSGDTVVLGRLVRLDEQTVEDGPPGARTTVKEELRRTLFVFVTARWVDSAARAVSDAAAEVLEPPPPAQKRAEGDAAYLPYGSPVRGKPGFVTSPYSPESGSVDVRGFPPNTKIKCPYSGKIFRVP